MSSQIGKTLYKDTIDDINISVTEYRNKHYLHLRQHGSYIYTGADRITDIQGACLRASDTTGAMIVLIESINAKSTVFASEYHLSVTREQDNPTVILEKRNVTR